VKAPQPAILNPGTEYLEYKTMPFLEIEFPRDIAFMAKGGPRFSTTVNKGFSGYEQRNQNWLLALGQWEVELNHKPQAYFQEVYDMWLVAAGQANSFRFFNPLDYQAFAQPIGVATGSTSQRQFQLQRTYTAGSATYIKPIVKPITSAVQRFDGTYLTDTVVIYINGSPATGGTWTVDPTTGIVTFSVNLTAGQIITADFQFDYPVRFDMDDCQAVIEESDIADGAGLVTWAGVQLVEVRL
jgi:uncharacterized protein (TIGR02217 family)